MTKQERHDAIRQRCRAAIRDLYHNATPTYPRLDDGEGRQFEGWFECAVEFEVDYLQSGGAYGTNYRRTLEADCNAGRYRSQRAREYYVEWKMRAMRAERERCNSLDSRERATNALWEYIRDYGRLYQYGRGGRTLAPDHLVHDRGMGFSLNESAAEDHNIAECVTMLRIVESFNRYVTDWCDSVPQQWREECAMRQRDTNDEAEALAMERD